MKSKSDHSATVTPDHAFPAISLVAAVSLADSLDSFQPLGNEAILRLSRQGGRPGFRDLATIERLTGVRSRRLLQPGITPLHLVHELSCSLQQRFGIVPNCCNRVLLCHSHVDPRAASTLAAAVATELGLPDSHVQGLNFGCTGFVQLLCEAVAIFQTEPDVHRIALFTVETPESWHCSADRLFCGIVGAGATAVVLERGAAQQEFRPPVQHALRPPGNSPATGSGWRLLGVDRADLLVQPQPADAPLFSVETCDGFTFHGEPVRRSVMRMQAEEVFVHGIELMLLALRRALKAHPPRPDQRVLVLPHQPSGKLLRAFMVAARHEFPGCWFVENLEAHGNSISCTIPQQLSGLPDVCQRNSFPVPRQHDLLIAVAAGICMHRKHDHMAFGYAVLQPA
ncbi:MAG: hypothetical protein ACKO2P_09745 [Planctomycetota bacterium]